MSIDFTQEEQSKRSKHPASRQIYKCTFDTPALWWNDKGLYFSVTEQQVSH